MAGLGPAIHVFVDCIKAKRGWAALTTGNAAYESKRFFRSKPMVTLWPELSSHGQTPGENHV
jgi:hypothetical protein